MIVDDANGLLDFPITIRPRSYITSPRLALLGPKLGAACLLGFAVVLPGATPPPLDDWSSRDALLSATFLDASDGPGGKAAVGQRQLFLLPPTGPGRHVFLPGNPGIVAVAGSPNHFVAVGYDGGVYRSSEGENWQSVTVPWNNNLFSVTYAFGRFIAVGGFGLIVQSVDGVWWEARQDIGTETLFRIASGAGRVLAVGKSGQIHSSLDGVTWQRSFFPEDGTFEAVAAGAGKHLAVTRHGIGRLSTDAVSWTRINVPSAIAALAGSSDHGFIAITAAGGLLRSPDALTWQELPVATPAPLSNVKWVGNQFLAVGAAATLLQSTNGGTWRTLDTRVTGWRNLAAHGDTRLALARGGTLLRTDNGGATWQGALTINSELRDIVRDPDRWWLVGDNAALMHSTDGWQWESIILNFATDLFALTRAQGRWVAVGAAGAVATSQDGVDWSLRPAGTTQALRDVLYDGTQFLAVGEGVFTRSGDGLQWTTGALPAGFSARALASLPGRRVVVGDAGRIAHSPDGVQWQELPATATNDLTHVIAANGAFVAAGAGGWLATSEDGLHWRTRILDPAADLGAPHFVEGRFEWMADSGKVWFSGNLHHPHLSLTRADTVEGWRVTARGRAGQAYRLEVNETVNGEWTEWQSFTLEGAARAFEDLASPPRRFYRLQAP